MTGDQFAPIDKPYMKQWRERLEAVNLAKAIKAVKKRKKGKKAKK
jgi:hypothetical protein